MEKNQAIKSVMAVILGLIAGALLMLIMGFNLANIKWDEWLFAVRTKRCAYFLFRAYSQSHFRNRTHAND